MIFPDPMDAFWNLRADKDRWERRRSTIATLESGRARLLEALGVTTEALAAECCGLCEEPGEYRDDDPRAWPKDRQAFDAWNAGTALLRTLTSPSRPAGEGEWNGEGLPPNPGAERKPQSERRRVTKKRRPKGGKSKPESGEGRG